MGSCSSVICAKRTVKKDEKIEKIETEEDSDEIGEIPSVSSVSIHFGSTSPSSAESWESESSPDIGSSAAMCSSVDALGNEADDELSSDTSSFSSGDESDSDQSRNAVNKLAKTSLPVVVRDLGTGQRNDDQSGSLESVGNPTSSRAKNERRLKQARSGGDGVRDYVKERVGPSGLHSKPSTSLSSPRPSQGNQACSKNVKGKEQFVENKVKRRPWGFWKKKRVRSQEEEMHTSKVRLIKKIKNALKRNAAQDSNSGAAALVTDETIAQIYGVTAEDLRDTSSNKSSSTCSPASTSTSSSSSWDSSLTSDEDLEAPGTDDNFGDVESANTPDNDGEARPRVTESRRTFVISKKDLQKPCAGLPCIGEEPTSEFSRNGQESLETMPPSTLNWDSWDSSTTSDEENEEPDVGYSDRAVKSTSEDENKEQTFPANSSCSTNSWDRSSTSESDDSACSELQTLIVESVSSWRSSGEDVKRLSTPELPNIENIDWTTQSSSSSSSDENVKEETLESANKNQRKKRKSRRWFGRFRKNKVVPL